MKNNSVTIKEDTEKLKHTLIESKDDIDQPKLSRIKSNCLRKTFNGFHIIAAVR